MTDPQERDGAAVRIPPPVIPLVSLVVGLLLSWYAFALPNPVQGIWRVGLGLILLGAGLGLTFAAIGLFRKTGQDPAPWKRSPELLTDGIYRHTRNPMYLGMGLLQAGLGIFFASLWVVVLVPVTWIVIYFIAIRHEEAYLRETFGEAYSDYCATVRRWL